MRKLVLCTLLAAALPALAQKADEASLKRGRYIAQIAGCNDCHTAGYAASGGKTPQKDWLMGDAVGWRGPWGTTYPTNLRLYLQDLTEEQWVKKAKNLKARPPMPWFALRDMQTSDLRAFYRFVRHLGPAGKPAPEYVPPDKTPSGPYIQFPG